jgi:hypothetical protein
VSDYLSNLAARTLGLTHSVRPRLPSRFEPPPGGPPPDGSPPGFRRLETERHPEAPDSDAPLTGSISTQDLAVSERRRAPGAEAARRREGDHSFTPRPLHDAQHSGRPSARSGQGNPHETSAPYDSADDDVSGRERQARAAQAGKPARVSPVASIKNAPPVGMKEGGGAAGESPGQRGGRSLENHTAKIDAGARNDPATEHAGAARPEFLPGAPPLGAPPVTPRSIRPRGDAPSRASDEGAESARAAPRIRVTIGRVEVRAVMAAPPPPARAARKATASPSLEDYLKKGERGER